MRWSDTTDANDACIFWLNGMAGTGKSTIARTVAGEWAKQGRLGASFFFSRGHGERAYASKFFTTLACQLAYAQPSLMASVHKAICDRPDIPRQTLREQWRHLILQPLSQLSDASPRLRLTLVIDALDECEDKRDIGLILQLLPEAETLGTVRLSVFVTSRPEIPIRYGFVKLPSSAYQRFILHEISDLIVDRDIALFLMNEFDKIRQRHRRLPSQWPDDKSLKQLIRKTGGLFIYAATVCRFVGERWPQERLTLVLDDSKQTGSSSTKQLDSMYMKVLRHAVKVEDPVSPEDGRLLHQFRQIVGAIVVLSEALSTNALAMLLDIRLDEVDTAVESLSSLLSFPETDDIPIKLLHPSFRDFLLDKGRCDNPLLFIDGENAHRDLAMNCLQLMSTHLKQDMCSLRHPGCLASEVDVMTVQQYISREVQYACRHWVDHLQRSHVRLCDGEPLHDRVHAFLKVHCLHWFESLSLMGIMHAAVLMVKAIDSMLTVRNPNLKCPS